MVITTYAGKNDRLIVQCYATIDLTISRCLPLPINLLPFNIYILRVKKSFSKKIPRNPDATQKNRFSGKNPEVVTLFITLRNFRFSFRCLLLPAQQREVRWWLVCK